MLLVSVKGPSGIAHDESVCWFQVTDGRWQQKVGELATNANPFMLEEAKSSIETLNAQMVLIHQTAKRAHR